MKTVFILPCSCGEKLSVDKSQAGLSLRCHCGADVAVPTLRGFAKLEQSTDVAETAKPEWGLRQGMLFLGSVICVLALVATVGLWLTQPRLPPQHLDAFLEAAGSTADLDTMSSPEIMQIWKDAKQGPDYFASAIITEYEILLTHYNYAAAIYRQRLGAAIAAAVLGAVIFGAALLVPKSSAVRRTAVRQ
jgi:hypothetical protein